MPHGKQLGRGGVVVVPDVVMDHLEVPQALAGARIEREQAIAEQIRAGAIRAVEVVLRAGGRGVDDAALLVDRKLAPRHWRRRRSSTRPWATCRSRTRPGAESCGRSRPACRCAHRRRGCRRAPSRSPDWWPSRESADPRTRARAWWIARAGSSSDRDRVLPSDRRGRSSPNDGIGLPGSAHRWRAESDCCEKSRRRSDRSLLSQ